VLKIRKILQIRQFHSENWPLAVSNWLLAPIMLLLLLMLLRIGDFMSVMSQMSAVQ